MKQTLHAKMFLTLSPVKKAFLWGGLFSISIVLTGIHFLLAFGPPALIGAGRQSGRSIPFGPAAPIMDRVEHSSESSMHSSPPDETILENWGGLSLPIWPSNAKIGAPRICLAKLCLGRDVNTVNEYLISATPWSESGSTWGNSWYGHIGDYDFTEVTLITILYLFGEKRDALYPATVEHILTVLLTDSGTHPRLAVPRSFGLVRDTENHHLMTEGSRYLKNQWLFEHGTTEQRGKEIYDNTANGLEKWLDAHLKELQDAGIYEFNSTPYLGFTVQALLNLDAFARSPEVAMRAHHLLDTMNWQYALGSLGLRRCAPFRRDLDYAVKSGTINGLAMDQHTSLMWFWTNPENAVNMPERIGYMSTEFSLLAALLPYRLPKTVREWTIAKPAEYFARFGRGYRASPEIYSGGPDYLLSAGGAYRGERSLIVSRPTTLLLNDEVTSLNSCLRIPGRVEYTAPNNTGVYRRFACGNSPVIIPESYTPAAFLGAWKAFVPSCAPHLSIVTYSAENLGLIFLFLDSREAPEQLIASIAAANPSPEGIRHVFRWPSGSEISYDVDAPAGTWVIERVSGEVISRNYDMWPQWSGDVPTDAFSREQ